MAPRSARPNAEKLVYNHAKEAIEFLVSRCDDSGFFSDMVDCVNLQEEIALRNPQHGALMSLAPPRPISPDGSQHSSSSRQPYRISHQSSPVIRRSIPVAPPTPNSSAGSQSSKDGPASGEWVYFFTHQGGVPVEVPLRLRTAQIQYSVIREDIVFKKDLNGDMVALHPFDVFVTRSDTPHILEQVQTKCSIKLVWRRPPSNRSRETIFYVVSSESLDTDVLLGYQDSEQVHPNQMGRSVSGSQRGHGIITEERDQEIRPPAPTPPLQSMHPSDNPYDGHTYGTRVQQHQDLPQQQPHHAFLHGLFERPQMRDAVVDGARHSHNSPTPTVLDTRSIVTEHPQPLGPSSIPTMTATSSHNGGQSPGIDKIRLNFTWDKAPINVWLDMAAPAEAFYLAFHRIAEKRKKMFERDSVSIWLRRDKEMAEGDGYELLLNESDLEGDWETTITWLKENKRDTAPHVIGRVEIDGG